MADKRKTQLGALDAKQVETVCLALFAVHALFYVLHAFLGVSPAVLLCDGAGCYARAMVFLVLALGVRAFNELSCQIRPKGAGDAFAGLLRAARTSRHAHDAGAALVLCVLAPRSAAGLASFLLAELPGLCAAAAAQPLLRAVHEPCAWAAASAAKFRVWAAQAELFTLLQFLLQLLAMHRGAGLALAALYARTAAKTPSDEPTRQALAGALALADGAVAYARRNAIADVQDKWALLRLYIVNAIGEKKAE